MERRGWMGWGRWLPSARFSDGSADASAAVFGATSLALAGDVSRLAVAAAGASSLVAPVVCSATAAGAGAGDLESLADMSGDTERRDDGEAVWMGRWCWLVQSGRSFGTVAALVTGGERGERAGPVFARHDRDGTRRVEGACSDKKSQGACSRDLVDGITMDWRGWGDVTWWRAQCAASRVGEQGRRWTMQGQSFLLNPVLREEEEREIIWHWRSVAQHEVVRASWGCKSGSSKVFGGGSWAKPRYMVQSMSVHVCLPRHWLL